VTHAPLLRPMGFLEIVDQTFRLYRANFWLFFTIAAVFYLPLGVLQEFLRGALVDLMAGMEQAAAAESAIPLFLGMTFAVFGIAMVAYLVVTAALTKAVSDRYMGESATVGRAYLHVIRRIIPLVLTLLIAGFLIYLGIFLLVLPGVLLFFSVVPFVVQVIIIEEKGYFAAMGRSRFLVGQGVWAVWLLLFMVIVLFQYAIQLAGTIPLTVLQAIIGAQSAITWTVGGLFAGIMQAAALPIMIVAGILLYYDSRIKKEGFDLEVLARELGKELLPPQAPAQGPSGAVTAPPQWPPSAPSQPPTTQPTTEGPSGTAEPAAGAQPAAPQPSGEGSSTAPEPSEQNPPPASQPTDEGGV
jgi:hypothetical protein